MPRVIALLFLGCLGLVLPAGASAQTSATGGAQFSDPEPIVAPGSKATLLPDGTAAAPADAPPQVQAAIFAANKLLDKPYKYGGGHAKVEDTGYDCSGTVSYALHGGNLLATPEDSSEFMKCGSHGAGRWVAVFGNSGHAYMDVAGLRLDTSAADDPTNQQGPRWRPLRTSNGGYTVRHPLGL